MSMRVLASIERQVYVCLCSLTICLSIDGALVEAHDVLSESPSLVTEYVFNLEETIQRLHQKF